MERSLPWKIIFCYFQPSIYELFLHSLRVSLSEIWKKLSPRSQQISRELQEDNEK